MADICPIGWFEIHVSDFDKAKDFYGDLFGWEFKRMESADFDYWTIFTGENSIGGGFMKKSSPEHEGHAVLIYVEVNDIEKTLSDVEKKGGRIEKSKTLISATAGYYGLLRDLDNNLIGVWSER